MPRRNGRKGRPAMLSVTEVTPIFRSSLSAASEYDDCAPYASAERTLASQPAVEQLHGHLDVVTSSRIAGWAADTRDYKQKIEVVIAVNDRPISRCIADQFRSDLREAGYGDGHHSFEHSLPVMSTEESTLTFRVFYGDTGIELPGSPVTISAANRSIISEFNGNFDSVDHKSVRGWAFIPNIAPRPAYIEMYVDDKFVTGTRANVFRHDLLESGIGEGRHGFEIPTPLVLLDSNAHKLSFVVGNSTLTLPNVPEKVAIHSPLPLRHFAQIRSIVQGAKDELESLRGLLSPDLADDILARSDESRTYQAWFQKYGRIDLASRTKMLAKLLSFKAMPTISVIMPTFNTSVEVLHAAVASVQNQLYPHWELCIADDASTSLATKELLREVASSESRIKVAFRTENGHISAATNTALSLATGDYVCFLDHDDILSEDALYQLARVANEGDYDIVYSDEDKIDEVGVHQDPHFKPDFNYTLLLSYNYFCHLLCIKRELVNRVGDFDSKKNGAQDYDYVLRCVEKTDPAKIKHIPLVLYHWRAHSGSTAASMDAKSYAVAAGQKAIRAHLKRTAVADGAVVQSVRAGYRVQWPLPAEPPKVSVVIPTRDCAAILARCLSGLLTKTSYKNIEVVIIDNGSVEDETANVLRVASADGRVKIIRHDAPFNYSEICNLGAACSSGELLLMLNNDIEMIADDWLDELVSQICRPGIGAVGAKLLYPNDTVQHAGVILGVGGVAGHAHKCLDRNSPGYMARSILAQELSACTAACLLIRRDVFDAVGGFNETELKVAFNDVDLCLRIRAAGLKIVFSPFATLYHHESLSRGTDEAPSKSLRAQREASYMRKKWEKLLDEDPCYSPNLTLDREDLSLEINRGYTRVG